VCQFKGTYGNTKTTGVYEIASLQTGNIKITGTTFRVYDYSLLSRYLILQDIDGFTYKDAKIQSGNTNYGTEVIGYFASYVKSDRGYATIVVEFDTRENLQKFIDTVFDKHASKGEKMGEYYIYAVSSGSQKIYLWTYKNFFVGVTEEAVYYEKTAQSVVPTQPDKVLSTAPAETVKTETVTSTPSEGDLFTGQITGMPIAAQPEKPECGMDSLNANCICASDEVKESFAPPCTEGVCGTHYKCRPHVPTELINAYLDRYPSDITSTGTQCEQKGGYCISTEDTCHDGFEGTAFTCKSNAEKCCVRNVDRSDFLEMVMKLEGMRVKMDNLERHANELADYYESTGDDERARKFSDVAVMFGEAKKMIDDIIAKIRANLENPDSVRGEIKQVIAELRNYINTDILKRMVS